MQSRSRKTSAALFALASLLPTGAMAFDRVTTAGHPVRIASHAFWDQTCRGQPALVQIVQEPEHGRLTARVEPIVIHRVDYGSGRCLGHQVEASAVYYAPQADFVGTDQFYYVSLKRNGDPVPHEGGVVVR